MLDELEADQGGAYDASVRWRVFRNLFYAAGPKEKQRFDLRPIGDGCALVVGDDLALVGTGAYQAGPIDIDAGLFYISASELAARFRNRLSMNRRASSAGTAIHWRPSPDVSLLGLVRNAG